MSSSLTKNLHKEKPYKEPGAKRIKVDGQSFGEKTHQVGEKMIELDYVSSDEEH